MKNEKSWIEEMVKISIIIIIIWSLFFIGYIFVSKNIGFYFTNVPSIPNGDILELAQLAQIGDSFNILTSLFAGLAFAAVIVTIKVQQNELEETREEFRKQREIMDLQQFDNKFFQMLSVFNDVRNNIKIANFQSLSGGDNIFEEINFKVSTFLSLKNPESFQNIFMSREINNVFATYYLTLYEILSSIKKKEKVNQKEYSNILRAKLSQNEIILLFYYCSGSIDKNMIQFKEFIEIYSFFEYISYEVLIKPRKGLWINEIIIDSVLLKYDINAFGKNKQILKKLEEINMNRKV